MKDLVLKISVGIDIGKSSFHGAIMYLLPNQNIKCRGSKKFANNASGFESFIDWINHNVENNTVDCYTMEATGVYYENLACYLYNKDFSVNVVLPNMAKKFSQSLNNKSKTDKLDSKILGRLGAERKLREWDPGSKIYQRLKKLTRERENIQKDRTRIKSMIHAENHSAFAEQEMIDRYNERLEILNDQLKVVEHAIKLVIKSDPEVERKVNILKGIPGVSLTTIAVVIAETFGFSTFTSMKQLTSFCGYDIIFKESGAYSGRTKISKKGNSHIRRVLYLPSYSAAQYNKQLAKFYDRLNEKKHNGLISGAAVQRKLLCLMYTLWKKDEVFIQDYELTRAA
jgi:transposase